MKQTKNLSVRHQVILAHLRHQFLVVLQLANLRYINIFNNNSNNNSNTQNSILLCSQLV